MKVPSKVTTFGSMNQKNRSEFYILFIGKHRKLIMKNSKCGGEKD